MKPLRIAFAGAHGVGKTSLARWLAEEKEMTLIPDLARKLRSSGRCPEEVKSVSDRAWILWEQIRLENKGKESFVVDGAIYAAPVYIANSPYPEYTEDFEFMATRYGNYDILFYVPVEFPPRKDYLRSDDMTYQEQVDETYRHFLEHYKIDYVEISGTIEDRKAVILHTFDEVRRNKTS